MTDDTNPVNWLNFGLSCITRLLFWGATICVIYTSIETDYSPVTWHVLFFTIGCALLTLEAILVVSGDALLAAKVSKPDRIRIHWILHILGLAMFNAGFWIITEDKKLNGFSHFTSSHGKVGLASFIVNFIVAFAAVPMLNRRLLSKVVNIDGFQRTHIYLGIISLILLWAGQITGFCTGWWTAPEQATKFTVAAYAIGGFSLIAKPFYATLLRSNLNAGSEV